MVLDYLKSSYLKLAHETMDASDQTATRRDKGYYTKLSMLLIAFFILSLFKNCLVFSSQHHCTKAGLQKRDYAHLFVTPRFPAGMFYCI